MVREKQALQNVLKLQVLGGQKCYQDTETKRRGALTPRKTEKTNVSAWTVTRFLTLMTQKIQNAQCAEATI